MTICEDFSRGIPADFSVFDNDRLSPAPDMEQMGFAVGTGWIATTPADEEGNIVACSTSRYAPTGQSDDWLILPPVNVEPGMRLCWRARTSDKLYRDGYMVVISTEGRATSCFNTDEPLYAIDRENHDWTAHQTDLSPYQGMTVSIAFVNRSKNRSFLYLDDIVVGNRSEVYPLVSIDSITVMAGDLPVEGTVQTYGEETVGGFTVTLAYGGKEYRQHFDQEVVPGRGCTFLLDAPLHIDNLETLEYTIGAETDGGGTYRTGRTKAYQRRVVGEDITGTWCLWCISGIAALDALWDKDWFVGMAVHTGNDPMTNDYASQLRTISDWSGIPTGFINRQKDRCGPTLFEERGMACLMAEPVVVAIEARAEVTDEGQLQTETTLHFAKAEEEANYRLAFVVVEDDVYHPDDRRYYQRNAYAGGASGSMGGYENLPDPIPPTDMHFQEVVRGSLGDFMGIPGSVPTAFDADEPLRYGQAFDMPATVEQLENCRLVVLLLDGDDGHVVNVQTAPIETGQMATAIDNQPYLFSTENKPSRKTIINHDYIQYQDKIVWSRIGTVRR